MSCDLIFKTSIKKSWLITSTVIMVIRTRYYVQFAITWFGMILCTWHGGKNIPGTVTVLSQFIRTYKSLTSWIIKARKANKNTAAEIKSQKKNNILRSRTLRANLNVSVRNLSRSVFCRLSWPHKKQLGAARARNQRTTRKTPLSPIKSGKNKRSPLDSDAGDDTSPSVVIFTMLLSATLFFNRFDVWPTFRL